MKIVLGKSNAKTGREEMYQEQEMKVYINKLIKMENY